MLILYGSPRSRASRCIWMLEELAVPYELTAVSDPGSEEYLAINPNGKVPCLRDGSVVVWESMAINLYLAQTYSSSLSPANGGELGGVLKWTLWAQSELEEHFNHVSSLGDVSADWMAHTMGVLEQTLATSSYLIGKRFTVADLNVCAMFMGPVSATVDLQDFPLTDAWRRRSFDREAAKTMFGRMRHQR